MRRIPLLDGWRGVAIALVLIHHVVKGFYAAEDGYAQSVTRYGAFGVDIFFGLSGLLITRLLLDQWRASGSFQLPQFYIRRAFRILPPYLVFLVTLAVFGLWKTKLELVSCLLFFRNYLPANLAAKFSGHLWSLAVEEHFYLIWPGLLAIIWFRNSRTITAALALAFGVWRMIESQLVTPLLPMLPQHFRSDLRMDALLWGCLMALLLDNPKELAKFKSQFKWPAWTVTAGILLLCIRFYSPLTSVWVAVLIPILLAGTLVNPDWRLSRALSWPPLVWLGRISYSLYLWQELFVQYSTTNWWQQWPWNVPAAVAVATLSYYFVEKPMIAMGRRLAESLPAHRVIKSNYGAHAPLVSPVPAGGLFRRNGGQGSDLSIRDQALRRSHD